MSIGLQDLLEGIVVYLCNTTDVFLAILGRESQILVQAKSNIVSIQSVGCKSKVEQMLLKCRRNGRLSRSREASEPDGGSLLLAKLAALLTAKALVPCNVASGGVRCGSQGC